MQSFHTIVIGAGPGGLACARLLALQGLKVLVLEKNSQVGPKVCGGGITWKGLIQHVPGNLINRSFQHQTIKTNKQKITIKSIEPIISTISREKLGKWMLEQAVNAGVALKTNINVIKVTNQSITAKCKHGGIKQYNYRYLVGADGSNSIVRKYLRIPSEQKGIGIHYLIDGEFEKMEWHLNTKLFGNGYAWIFPYVGFASVGVYTDGSSLTANQMLNNFHFWADIQGINLEGLKPRAGLINFDYRGWRFGHIMLVGDAAGLASGLTGEGMYPALISGVAAAETIINPFHTTDKLNRLIRKQQKHRQILSISGKNKMFCSLTMETLAMGLRSGLIPVSKLEMAD